MKMRNYLYLSSAVIALAACSGDQKESGENEAQENAAPASAAATATGDTITIEAYSDGTGNYFKPNKIEAHQGDVLHFVLKSGVHNVHFLPDSNTIKTGLPPAGDMLQLPDQAYDLVVNLQEGQYYFQCDPHAMLGMKGTLEVEDKD